CPRPEAILDGIMQAADILEKKRLDNKG
ncbi:MAG TPA: NADH:ubiquinone oxidoreductase, partial [Clostridiaceae bacterium]|nr:NADH:ubiquinone oxidoreductase [Clostridiaceae bacterium]